MMGVSSVVVEANLSEVSCPFEVSYPITVFVITIFTLLFKLNYLGTSFVYSLDATAGHFWVFFPQKYLLA